MVPLDVLDVGELVLAVPRQLLVGRGDRPQLVCCCFLSPVQLVGRLVGELGDTHLVVWVFDIHCLSWVCSLNGIHDLSRDLAEGCVPFQLGRTRDKLRPGSVALGEPVTVVGLVRYGREGFLPGWQLTHIEVLLHNTSTGRVHVL